MSKYDQCEHRLHCGTCVKTGKLCPHINSTPVHNPYDVEPLPRIDWTEDRIGNIPQCCLTCPNHPINGGSGICNCVSPYMSLSSTGGSYSIINNGDGTYTVDSSQKYNGNDTVTISHTYTDHHG